MGMMQGVRRTLDLTGPTWHDDAAKYGGRSMSVAGFNNGYVTPKAAVATRVTAAASIHGQGLGSTAAVAVRISTAANIKRL